MYAICARCYALNTTSTSTSPRRQCSVIHGGSGRGGVSVSGVHPLEELSLQVAHPVHVARRVRVIEGEGHRLADDARLYGQRALIGRYLLDVCPSMEAEYDVTCTVIFNHTIMLQTVNVRYIKAEIFISTH